MKETSIRKNMQTSLDHLNLTVQDFEESVSWYANIFGFRLVERGMDEEGPWGILRNGDSMLCIYESPKRSAPEADNDERFHKIYHFGLRIRDREDWERKAKEYSLPTYYGSPVRYPHSTSWYVTDPSGHMIEVALWDEDQVRFGG